MPTACPIIIGMTDCTVSHAAVNGGAACSMGKREHAHIPVGVQVR